MSLRRYTMIYDLERTARLVEERLELPIRLRPRVTVLQGDTTISRPDGDILVHPAQTLPELVERVLHAAGHYASRPYPSLEYRINTPWERDVHSSLWALALEESTSAVLRELGYSDEDVLLGNVATTLLRQKRRCWDVLRALDVSVFGKPLVGTAEEHARPFYSLQHPIAEQLLGQEHRGVIIAGPMLRHARHVLENMINKSPGAATDTYVCSLEP